MASLITGLLTILARTGFRAILDVVIPPVVSWWVSRQTVQVLTKIADTAAYAARAQSDEERYVAAQKWQDTLGLPRNFSN